MTTLESQSPSRNGSWLNLHAALCSVVAAAPFLLFPLIHFARWGTEATGFTTYDLPYYVANARAILDHGHAGLYPNPFDPNPAAPAIYFHWLMAVLAGLIGPLGLDPGRALLLVQIIGAMTSARVMFSLITWLLPPTRWRTLSYFLTMWSGGLLVIGRVLANVSRGVAWNADLLALDPGHGLWCLNFGRNLILPTEAFYHALMLGLWLSVLKAEWTKAALLLLAITSTHPFTGAQALAIVGAYVGVQALAGYLQPETTRSPKRSRSALKSVSSSLASPTGGENRGGEPPNPSSAANTPDVFYTVQGEPRYFVRKLPFQADVTTRSLPPLPFLLAYVAIASAFVAYYFIFLPRFPEHREIQHTWTLGWTLSRPTILLAYTPAAILAWLAVRKNSLWRRQSRFLLVAAGVSFLLANHQWFITPRQPIHFTRGYIWTPLFLAGLPILVAIFDRIRSRGRLAFGVTATAITLLAVSDNAAFLLVNAASRTPPGFNLSTEERAVFADLNHQHLTGVLLTDDDRLGYLAAALTSARPWLGHKYNTPHFDERLNRLTAFKATSAAGELLDEVDLAVTADPRVIRRLQDNGWQRISAHGDLQLWQKPF